MDTMGSRSSDVVVTAMGVVAPLGATVAEFRDNMFAGRSGIRNIRGSLVDQSFPIPYAGWVDRSKLPKAKWQRQGLADSALFSVLATEQCLHALPDDAHVDAIVYGTAESIGYGLVQDSFKKPVDLATLKQNGAEYILQTIAALLKDSGKCVVPDSALISINSACASGNQAIGMAMQRIRDGKWTRAIVGGVDTRCSGANLMNFNMLGALSTAEVPPETSSKPFAGDRCGFVRGEGAATLLIETRKSAEARGAKILGIISGYGFTSDAYRLTDGRDDALAVIKALETAIADSGLKKSDIDTISAHGTSTQLNDRLETQAIKAVFGTDAYKIPVTSLKSQIGHSTVAAGAIESISCLLMLEAQVLAPTINYLVKDPECDLDYVPNKSRPAKVRHILSNNFGFGGQNACIVISHD
jgi:3-oxoacyl-[acyl-carrier-protein] synthase II